MRATTAFALAALALALDPAPGRGDDVLFEDTFKDGLSKTWQVVGLDKKDYRVKDGGLEMRVQNGKEKKDPPMLKVVLSFQGSESVSASVTVTLLDEFTGEKEAAGVFLLDDTGWEFAAKKERVGGKLVFAPGKYVFKGKKGEEGDVDKYDVKYTAAARDAGPLRILVDRGNAFFQVGPSAAGEYLGFFHSAIHQRTKKRGFGLAAYGAPEKADHWVRFTDFKVVKH